MSKQKLPEKPQASIAVPPMASLETPNAFKVNNLTLGLLTLGAALFYAFYSTRSDGFYQQDEAGHFISMLDFWHNPNVILSNWAKPGYKLIYVVPALLGKNAVMLLNCIFAALSGLLAYKIADKMGSRRPLLAMILLVTQPLWVALSFRNYSEIPSSFLLALAVYLHLIDKRFWAALVASYICTIRQEFIPILAVYGVYLLYTRHFVIAFSLALFPLLQNVWGGIVFNDYLYLWNQVFGASEGLKDAYPRQGFDHYWVTSIVVFGAGAVVLLVAYVGTQILQRKQPAYLLLVPILLYILINSLFNWQGVHIGPATGGNLRYMLFLSPLVAVLGALAADEYEQMPDRWRIVYFLLPLAIVVGVYLNYKHNYVVLTDEADSKPLLGVMLISIALLVPLSAYWQTISMGLILFFIAAINTSAIKLSDEDTACREAARWYKQNEAAYKGKELYVNHVMFFYFLEKTRGDFQPEPKYVTTDAEMQQMPKGSLVVWDSHYAYRPSRNTGLNIDYFINKPDQYTPIQQFLTPQQNFGIVLLERK